MTNPTKSEEKILKEFDERWWQIENPDTINQRLNRERQEIKSFLLSSLRQQREDGYKEGLNKKIDYDKDGWEEELEKAKEEELEKAKEDGFRDGIKKAAEVIEKMNNLRQAKVDGKENWNMALEQSAAKVDALIEILKIIKLKNE